MTPNCLRMLMPVTLTTNSFRLLFVTTPLYFLTSCSFVFGIFSPPAPELALSSVEVVEPRDLPKVKNSGQQIPNKRMLRISLISNMDFVDFMRRSTYEIASESVFLCEDEENIGQELAGSFGPYWHAYDISKPPKNFEEAWAQRDPGQPIIYYIYLDTMAKDRSRNSSPTSYDLLGEPRNLCLNIRGGATFAGSYKTNTVFISQEMIEAALTRAGLRRN